MLLADVKGSYFPQFCQSECSRVLETSWKAYSRAVRLNMKLILVSNNLNEDPFFSKERSWGAGRLATFSPGFFPSLFAADLRSHLLLRNKFLFCPISQFLPLSPPSPRPTLTPNKKYHLPPLRSSRSGMHLRSANEPFQDALTFTTLEVNFFSFYYLCSSGLRPEIYFSNSL